MEQAGDPLNLRGVRFTRVPATHKIWDLFLKSILDPNLENLRPNFALPFYSKVTIRANLCNL